LRLTKQGPTETKKLLVPPPKTHFMEPTLCRKECPSRQWEWLN